MESADKIFSILNWVIQHSPAEKTEIIYLGGRSDLTRFTHSAIHQNVSSDWQVIFLKIVNGRKIGVLNVNTFEKESLLNSLKMLNETVHYLPENPHFEDLAKPADYEKVEAYKASTASCSPLWRSEQLLKVFKKAALLKMEISGSFSTGWSETAIVNSNGLMAYFPSTRAELKIVPMADDSLGYAEYLCRDIDDMPVEFVAEKAIRTCDLNRDQRELATGSYTVILEPECVAEILEWMAFSSLSSRAFLDGISFMSGRSGQQITGRDIVLYDSFEEPEFQDIPFDYEGTPKQKVTFLQNGLVRDMIFDRLSGAEAGKSSTGHALLPGGGDGPVPLNLCLAPGNSSIQEMIENCEKGIYITKFHYVNGLLNIPKALMTGMTRYGTFLVEEGKIRYAVKNLRWTQSWLEAFSNVKAITSGRKIVSGWWGTAGATIAPGMMIDHFNITGITG